MEVSSLKGGGTGFHDLGLGGGIWPEAEKKVLTRV